MKLNRIVYSLFFCSCLTSTAQHTNVINASIQSDIRTITIDQTITYKNSSSEVLNELYLSDWNNSYSSNETPLAKWFAEEFKNTFQFSNASEKGFTTIQSIKQNETTLEYNRLAQQQDIIKVDLDDALLPGQNAKLHLQYVLTLPSDKFTRYGYTADGDLNLQYWYITPAVYNKGWQFYSNKNLSDLYNQTSSLTIHLSYPSTHSVTSELDITNRNSANGVSTITLNGDHRLKSRLLLTKTNSFTTTATNAIELVSDIDFEDLDTIRKNEVEQKILSYITTNFGAYPHKKLVVTQTEYRQDPIYGLNLLPKFIRPFPDTFQYELKLLKTALKGYLQNSLLLNPRKDYWLLEGIQTYFLMDYVSTFYPEMKLIGKFSEKIGLRWFHAADLDFNAKYIFLYMHMARSNLDQAIITPKDSLIKFNETIANKYKTALGFNYLDAYDPALNLKDEINKFIITHKLNGEVSVNDFLEEIKLSASKNTDWFYNSYLATNHTIDYKFKETKIKGDSISITLKNKQENTLPITLDFIKNDSIIFSKWISDSTKFQTYTLAHLGADKLKLNASKIAPEYNLRNNHKNLSGIFNKPLQVRLLKDVEDPDYNQIFLMPDVSYNFYDGLIVGAKFYNKTILTKNLAYRFIPSYGIKSNQFNGRGVVTYTHNHNESRLAYSRYGLSGQFNNYAPELSFYKFSPFVQFRFRDNKNLRKNHYNFLTVQFNSIYREEDPTGVFNDGSDPNYNVFGVTYGASDKNLTQNFSWYTNFQAAENFGKLIFSTNYRKITSANREYNLRFYAGAFLYNSTPRSSNYFSFALDRPTDYLFEYEYLGRSETTGVLSQQLIIAEGGFKSKLDTAFANQWLTTVNANTTIWRYIYAYGDIGLIKNKDNTAKFVYDSGIRLSLVADYFELYFPIYSNLGWEIGQPNYDQKIRFIVTLSPKTLLGLFTRRWY